MTLFRYFIKFNSDMLKYFYNVRTVFLFTFSMQEINLLLKINISEK